MHDIKAATSALAKKGDFNELRSASVSDIHLGHKRNPTQEIIRNLELAFPDNAETGQLDVIWLVGDLFDGLMSLTDPQVGMIIQWVYKFLSMCKRRDIVVRCLRGTPSHDWEQAFLLQVMNQATDIGADFKYVKELSIEYIERFGITVLYVPDEWSPTSENTLSQVHELLRSKGLDSVDYALMHGQFEYQLPPHVKAQKHSSEAYLRIVRELIYIGHVHVTSTYADRIIAQGSFDRLGHGEPGPKGHVRTVVRANGQREITFVENKQAKKFVTINCGSLSLEETIREADSICAHLPEGSFVRVEANHDNPIFSNMVSLISRYPAMKWSTKPIEIEEEAEPVEQIEDAEYSPIAISKDNIYELLMERVAEANPSSEVFSIAYEQLREVVDGR